MLNLVFERCQSLNDGFPLFALLFIRDVGDRSMEVVNGSGLGGI
jgi:hypothetical protein